MFRTRPVIAHTRDHAVVSLTGDVDLTVRSEILESYERAIALMDVPQLVVDVSGVTFMDSTGLNTLATVLQQAQARGGTVTMVGASNHVMTLLHIVQLDTVLTVLTEDGCPLTDAVPRSGHHNTRRGMKSRRSRPERCGTDIRGRIRPDE